MGFPALQRRTWTRFLCLLWICVEGREATPQYMVAVPGVMEVGSEAQFCASLMHPDEVLVMTVILMSNEANTTLFTHSSSQDFHICSQFTAPLVNSGTTNLFKVEVKGSNFSSVEMRKVSFEVFRPMDPNNNRIGQWLNESSKSKWLEHSYSLNSEAKQGHYKIVTYSGSNNFETYHSFRVKKYVLPKFEVHVNAPSTVNVAQEEFQIEACVKYTYGQSVPGSAEVKVCRRIESYRYRHMNLTDLCSQQTKQLIISNTCQKGCTSFTFDVSTFTKLDPKALRDDFNVKVKVEEEGTGVSASKDKHMRFSYQVGTLSFFDMPASFKQGSVVEGKIRALHYNNTPIPDLPVFLFESWFQNLIQNLTTDSNGTAAFSMRTDTFKGDVHLTVSKKIPLTSESKAPHFRLESHQLRMWRPSSPDTKSVSSLQVKNTDKNLPCDSKYNVTIKYTIVGEAEGSVDIMYLVLSSNVIITQGFSRAEVNESPVSEGEVFFTLRVSPEMAPNFKIVAYAVLPSETVIAHRADFNTEKCFSHKVSLEFSPPSTAPGEEIDLQVAAQPNSICGISAVDKSVLIEDASSILNEEKVIKKSVHTSRIPHEMVKCLQVRTKRYIISNPQNDQNDVFQDAGLKMVTNLDIRKPVCLMYKGEEYTLKRHFGQYLLHSSKAVAGQAFRLGSHIPSAPPIETVRNFFPETWIWDLVEVGESGRKDVPLKVPDTITTWETEAFCLSPQGFGLAPRQKFTVFQPFFLELTIPYSIIRGENFELKATVFNYLTSCLMISVTPSPSSDYTLTPLPEQQLTSCLCGSERKTLSWTFNPSALGVVNVTVSAEAVASHISCDNEIVSVPERGRIDVVTRSLIVKPEGTEMSKTYNFLLCPNGDALTDEIDVHLPENVIGGSARASVSVLGDILGRALKNLDGLLRMPYGCGEQNMALLAPNIYILQYLKGTQQLTPAIREKATNFLTSGYQKQLNYKHRDGAYSTFGTGAGNTWLTAFVLRSFAKAQSFIYIDPAQIKESNSWLNHKQKENGCFQQSGKLFNNRMKGGVSDEVTLSAYITAAFLEMNISSNDPVLVRSLSCLKESMSDLSNTYTTALMAYVFSLAGDVDARDRLLQHLDSVAIREGGFLHWSQKATETSASLSVEISSYVLLAKLGGSPTVGDLGYASSIVRWLTGQQNSYGGFSSTQDTVVALQALALYSTLVFSPEGSSTVTLQAPSGPLMFEVNPDNKLLYQESALQDVTGKFSLEVNGSACVSAQVSLHYNIPTPRDPTSLSVEVTTKVNCTKQSHQPKVTLELKSLYSGQENSTNMVILDIKVLSGFVPDSQSLNRLQRALLVDRVDHKEDHVLVYLQQLLKDKPVTHRLELVQELPVQNLKPAVVHIYDYYQPSDKAEREYIYPCTAGNFYIIFASFLSFLSNQRY
uniref:Alpha-2-macroglobulin domain-containing protein n=1 Tax=Salarias fasciatus TaxID=181472 RepID=A0A672JD68_SALFA